MNIRELFTAQEHINRQERRLYCNYKTKEQIVGLVAEKATIDINPAVLQQFVDSIYVSEHLPDGEVLSVAPFDYWRAAQRVEEKP